MSVMPFLFQVVLGVFMLGAGACGKESMYSNWLCWPNVQVLALIQSCCCTLLLCPWLNS